LRRLGGDLGSLDWKENVRTGKEARSGMNGLLEPTIVLLSNAGRKEGVQGEVNKTTERTEEDIPEAADWSAR